MATGRIGRRSGSTGRAGTDVELVREGAGARKAAAYHAVPPRGRGKGVLVVDGSGALTDFARDACDRLARAGFAALAPDLAGAADADDRLAAGVRQLLDDDATDGPRVGAIGFGEGAPLALGEGARNRRIGCVVCCYGLPEAIGEASGPEVPVLLVFGEEDARVGDGAAGELERSLASARLCVEPGAGDGFMDEGRADRYHAAAAAAAWDAVCSFLWSGL